MKKINDLEFITLPLKENTKCIINIRWQYLLCRFICIIIIIICIRMLNESGYMSMCIVNYECHQIIIFEIQFVYTCF